MMGVTQEVPDWLAVSRETVGQLEHFMALVAKWNKTINLVSSESLLDGWRRHVLDSAQLVVMTDRIAGRWVDMGSGAGFPGLVVAILSKEVKPGLTFTLVESDRRKATFLSEASRQLDLPVEVICDRVETLRSLQATVVSARAFAPLIRVLRDAKRHLLPDGEGLFLKGQTYEAEIADAQKGLDFSYLVLPSLTHDGSAVIKVQGIGDAGA